MLPEYVITALEILNNSGYDAYVVGGAVRDYLLGKTPFDFDITTSASPEEVISLFEKTIPTGLSHGTVTVLLGGKALEITTFRSEAGYSDNRHPDKVNFVLSVREDISRRDFTVNALLMDKNGEIIDYSGGKKDIENKIIRTVGDADCRFSEDALRILRALRFSSVLGFEIEKETKEAIKKNYNLLKNVSAERIREEFFKLLKGRNAEKIIKEFIEVFKFILPELSENNLKLLNRASDLYERLALVFPNEGSLSALSKLKCSNEQKSSVENLTRFAEKKTKNEIGLRLYAAEFGVERTEAGVVFLANIYDDYAKLKSVFERIKENLVTPETLGINGEDIKKLGYEGREIGEIKRLILKEVAEGKLENYRDDLIKRITK